MSRRAKSELTYLAPGASHAAGTGTAKVWLPGASEGAIEAPSPDSIDSPNGGAWPAPDEHLVEPESGREMLDGRVMEVTPADAPHADKQCDLVYVLRAHVAPGYVASTELLTRVAEKSNFSTDACIRREGSDAKGHRYLEELSFEVQHTQSEASLNKRARYLQERGVRRVIAIEVKMADQGRLRTGQVQAGPVKEWVPASQGPQGPQGIAGRWHRLAADELIEDRCLQRPVKVAALMDAVEADNAVARALMARQNPAILAMRQQSFDKGHDKGHEQGFDKGHEQGFDKGREQGFDEGHEQGFDKGREQGFNEGHEQGFDEGIEQGQIRGAAEGNRLAIAAVCEVLGIALTPARRAKLGALNSDESLRLLTYLRTNKNWDDSLD